MKLLFTICGRAGSKGINNKNIRDFLGIPLPYYSLSAIDMYLNENREVSFDIVVNSDSQELISLMENNPMRKVSSIVRDDVFAGDDIAKIDVINNSLELMQKRTNSNYDAVIDLDITSPLRKVDDLNKLINAHFKMKADVTTTVTQARRNPFFNQVIETERGVQRVVESNYTTRQQAPKVLDMNASMYAYCPDYLKSGKGVLDGYVEVVEMYDTGILDLDHENDFVLMEVIADYLYKNNNDFSIIRENIINSKKGKQ